MKLNRMISSIEWRVIISFTFLPAVLTNFFSVSDLIAIEETKFVGSEFNPNRRFNTYEIFLYVDHMFCIYIRRT